MRIEAVAPSALSAGDLERWRALQAADSALDSPFLSPAWALAVEAAQASRRGQVRVAVARDDAGEAKAFFPARVAGATAMPVGAPMCDYQGLIAETGLAFDPRALVKALGAQRLDFSHMLQDQAAFAPYQRGESWSWIADQSAGYAAYQDERREAGSGVLKDIDKRRRKIERDLGEVTFTAGSASRADFDQLIAWKRTQYAATGQTDIFAAGWTLDLLAKLFEAESADPAFGGRLFTLHIGNQLAAAQFNLMGARTVHAWIIAHGSAYEKVSPGLVLFGEILKWMDGGPYAVLDLGAGDYRFKQQLSNTGRKVAHGFAGRPSPVSLVRSAEYGVRAAAETLPLGPLSRLPGKAMRRMDLWRGLR